MRVRHITDAEVIALLDDPAPAKITPERKRLFAHLTDCQECGDRLNQIGHLIALLTKEEVWEQLNVSEMPSPWLRRATEIVKQIAAEREGLDDVLEGILRGSRSAWKAKLALNARLHTYGMVQALLDRAVRVTATAPPDALELTTIAVDIADHLSVDSYPFDFVLALRAHACREHAFSLYYAGRMPEALRFVERAERLFEQTPLPTFDLARVAVMRAIIYRDTDRLAEAIPLVHGAAAVFLSFGDRPRYISASMNEAIMRFKQREYREALAIWQPLEDEPSIQNQPTFGMLLQHLGSAYRHLNDFDRARSYYSRAITEHRKHNAFADELHVHWSLALTLMAEQKQRQALPILREVWRRFQELQMAEDAALAGLKLAEVLLMLDQPAEVPAICRTLLDHFARNNTKSAGVTALSFLREAVAAGKAKPSLVSDIYDFVRDLPKHPTRAFSPPEL